MPVTLADGGPTVRTAPRGGRPRVGLLLNTLSYTYQNDLLRGAHDTATALDADLYCFSGGPLADPERIKRSSIYGLIGEAAVDALIVSTSTLGNITGKAGVLEFCRRFSSIPLCSVGAELEGVPSLLVDNFSGVRDLTTHLIDVHKRSRIAFVSGPAVNEESQRRLAGYRAALAARHLPASDALVVEGDFTHRAGVEAVARFFDEGGGCDAIVTANDWTALGVLEALDKRRLRVPQDVAVVGFDDIDEARFAVPSLSTVRQPIRELGAQAARLVLAQLAGGGRPEPSRTLPTRPLFRHSCGCFDVATPAPSARPVRIDLAAGTLARQRDHLVKALAEAMPRAGDASDEDHGRQAARLFGCLHGDVVEGTHHRFLECLDELLGQAASWGNLHAWHATMTLLRTRLAPVLGRETPDNRRLEPIIERAHVAISAAAEREQGRRRIQQEGLLRKLQQTAASLRAASDVASLAGALADSLVQLGVPSCSVALKHGARLSAETPAGSIVAYDQEVGLIAPVPAEVRCDELIMPAPLPARRRSMVLQPLIAGGEVLGFFGLEIGPIEGTVHEVLREQLSAAVKGVQLFETVVDAVTRREQAERARLQDEVRIAARIQTSIFPKTTSVSTLEIAAAMLPTTEVGGDYFDVLPFEGGCWLGIGDVAGHGLPTGLVMLMIQSIVAATTRSSPAASAGTVWTAVNNVLHENIRRLNQDEYATLSLIRYESNGRLTLAGAHEELIIYRAETGQCETLPLVGTWAGLETVDDPVIPEASASLRPGDLLILYTDGVTEAMNADNEQFGVDRLCRTVAGAAGATSDLTEIRDRLVEAVRSWSKAQFDDVTVVVIRQRA